MEYATTQSQKENIATIGEFLMDNLDQSINLKNDEDLTSKIDEITEKFDELICKGDIIGGLNSLLEHKDLLYDLPTTHNARVTMTI